MHHFRFRFISLFLCTLICLASCPALSEDPLYPALDHPADRYIQSLCVMSQQDSAFEGVHYSNGWLTARGCQPLSLANGIIAAFEVTDRETAIDLVLEATKLLAPGRKSRTLSVNAELLPDAIDPQARAAESEDYPCMAAVTAAYPGAVSYIHEVQDAAEVIERIKAQSAPAIIGSRMYVVNTWEDVVRIAYALHDMGMDNSTIILSRAEVGKDTHGGPMRSGKYGHYLTSMLHVGAFVESGAVYILDSLPRALENEESGGLLRSRYHFPEDRKDGPFNSTFSSARISPTIIKLYLQEDNLAAVAALEGEARIAEHTAQLKPLLLFGSCSMLISLKAQ